MKTQLKQALRLVVLATAAAIATPAFAQDGDAGFDAMVEMQRHRQLAGDEWRNPYMVWGTGQYAAQSADEVLVATLRIYTREVLDRGYWVNAWVDDAPGYDAGNPLLAVAQGAGVTTLVAAADGGLRLGAPRSALRFAALRD